MAKGRRLTTSRSERLLGSYSYGHSQGDTVTDETELGEEDVWSMVDNVADRDDQSVNNSQREWSPRTDVESNGNGNLDVRGHRHRTPRADRHVGGLSLAFEDSSSTKPRIVHQFRYQDGVAAAASPRGHHFATSAPVNVPDWSKIYRVDSVESIHDSDDGLDDGDSVMVPPHEYLAREYARSKNSGGASVFEGVGRTLKGRDLRRVRDAVWSQTGQGENGVRMSQLGDKLKPKRGFVAEDEAMLKSQGCFMAFAFLQENDFNLAFAGALKA